MTKVLLISALWVFALTVNSQPSLPADEQESIFWAWENFNSGKEDRISLDALVQIADKSNPQDLLQLIRTKNDPGQWMAFIADALSKKLSGLSGQEILDAYFAGSQDSKNMILRALGSNTDENVSAKLMDLWEDPRVRKEEGLLMFGATLPQEWFNERNKIEAIFRFLSTQPFQKELVYGLLQVDSSERNLFLEVIRLDSPYSENYNCVLISLVQLLPLAATDTEVRTAVEKYLKTQALQDQELQQNLGLGFILMGMLESLIQENPESEEHRKLLLTFLGQIKHEPDQTWGKKAAPFITLWQEQASPRYSDSLRKEIVEASIDVAKRTFFGTQSDTLKTNREAMFDEIKEYLFIQGNPVASLAELEEFAGFRIESLGVFYELTDVAKADPDFAPYLAGLVKWGDKINPKDQR